MEGTTRESFFAGPEEDDYSKAFNEPVNKLGHGNRTIGWIHFHPCLNYKMIDITNKKISTDRRMVLEMGAIYNELLRYTEL